MTEEKRKKEPCEHCGQFIFRDVSKCHHCGSFQDWRSNVLWFLPSLSLLLAFAVGFPTIVGIWQKALSPPRSEIRTTFLEINSVGVSAKFLNIGEKPAIIAGDLECVEDFVEIGGVHLSIIKKSKPVAFPDMVVDVKWEVWNLRSAGGKVSQGNAEKTESALRNYLEEYPPEDVANLPLFVENKIETLRATISQPNWAPMRDRFMYYFVIAARVELETDRELPEAFAFKCSFDIEDGTENPHEPEFSFVFWPGSFGPPSDFTLN